MIYTPADANGEFRYADDLHTLTVTAIVATRKWYYDTNLTNIYPVMVYIESARDAYLPDGV